MEINTNSPPFPPPPSIIISPRNTIAPPPSPERKPQSPEIRTSPSQYYLGSAQTATINSTATLTHLLTRAALTRSTSRLCIVLVGLPGRGKSFLSRKLCSFLQWRGLLCKIFNVGSYRRAGNKDGGGRAAFFDKENIEGAKERERVAGLAVDDMIAFLDSPLTSTDNYGGFGDSVAILDATNSTNSRRAWLLGKLKDRPNPIGVVFVESICDDPELLEDNFKEKIGLSPDFAGMTEEDAMKDLKLRVANYERLYETIDDDSISYIKIYNLSAKLLANQIFGRMSKSIIPCLMAWNIGTRPIWLCRAGETTNESSRSWGVGSTTMSAKLNEAGRQFRGLLECFVRERAKLFWEEQIGDHALASRRKIGVIHAGGTSEKAETGVKIMTSTMPRAIGTASFSSLDYKVEQSSYLNPLDKGEFSGMEMDEIESGDPQWYAKLKADPYSTRFPGGESYADLVQRLESSVVDMEQQVAPVLVVSHVSVLQCLVAYFRGSAVRECQSIAIPMDTVVEMTPVMGGGWSEARFELSSGDGGQGALPTLSTVSSVGSLETGRSRVGSGDLEGEGAGADHPIWGDAPRRQELGTRSHCS